MWKSPDSGFVFVCVANQYHFGLYNDKLDVDCAIIVVIVVFGLAYADASLKRTRQ